MGWVGLGQSADGMGWIGSHKMDTWTTLVRRADAGTRADSAHDARLPASCPRRAQPRSDRLDHPHGRHGLGLGPHRHHLHARHQGAVYV